MRLERIRIQNFRNLRNVDVRVGRNIVVVGENKVGKSNFLHALRLVLDPSLSDSARQLRLDDFSDSLARPLARDARIVVSVDLADFQDSNAQLALFADHLVLADPMKARLTYVFGLRAGAPQLPSEADYEFFVFGGEREDNRVSFDIRRRAPMDMIHALRDAESDLANWRRSPLRPLLTRAAALVAPAEKAVLAKGVDDATSKITAVEAVADVERTISETLDRLAGKAQTTDVSLGFAPTDAERLLRSLRLFVDGGSRGVSEASLGVANTLFFVLKLLEIEQLVLAKDRDHTFLAIEEPEAHLHPHLQRNVFRGFFQARGHLVQGQAASASVADGSTVILTTHSPHLASIAPLRSLLMLRRENGETRARSTVDLACDEREERDLERYLDVTRGELLFARGVVLVEGDAEEFLLPVLARQLGLPLDASGVSICSVSGAYFTPYVQLLRHLEIPFVLITDGDPDPAKGTSAGESRARALLATLVPQLDITSLNSNGVRDVAMNAGVFVGDHTFEVDLFRSGWHEVLADALSSLTTNGAAKTRAVGWRAAPQTLDPAAYLADIKPIGKGRFAQRVATTAEQLVTAPAVPAYVASAINAIALRVG